VSGREAKRDRDDAVSDTRRAIGTWLDGPPRLHSGYPGERRGLPESGRGSVAGFGEKLLALIIDLLLSSVIGLIIVRPGSVGEERTWNWTSVGVFVIVSAGLLMTTGRTIGQRVMALQVVRLDGQRIGARALFRQLLVALLVPPLITDRDRRGLHDRFCNTLVVHIR
jgi:uncharacterized RDD family membrane protein YckC